MHSYKQISKQSLQPCSNHGHAITFCLTWMLACACFKAQAQETQNLARMFQTIPLSTAEHASTNLAPTSIAKPLNSAQMAEGASPLAQVLGAAAQDTVVKAYTVTHMRASDVQALLCDASAPLLSRDNAAVVVDSRSNTLLVKGTPAEHQLVDNLLQRLDQPAKQVLLEVKIISADDFFGKSLGARFAMTASNMLNAAKPRNEGVQVGSHLGELNQIASNGTSSFPSGVNLPATNNLTSAAVSTFALGFYKLPAGINIGMEISALEEAGHTKVLSTPRLVLSNQRPGLISSGQRIPYSKPTLVQGVNSTEFIDVKVSVAVTALVAPDGAITLDLTLNDDSVGMTSSVGPTINTNQATSYVTMRSGETLLLGGFHSSSSGEERNKTPVLGDVPYLGHLFRNQNESMVKRELLFIITPTVIDNER